MKYTVSLQKSRSCYFSENMISHERRRLKIRFMDAEKKDVQVVGVKEEVADDTARWRLHGDG